MLYRFMDEMAGAVDVDNYMLNRSMFHKLVLHGQTTSHLKNRKKKVGKSFAVKLFESAMAVVWYGIDSYPFDVATCLFTE